MNPFKKLQHFFIGAALAKSDDVFEQVKTEVLFNFTLFFLVTNIPYAFVPGLKPIQLSMAISVIGALLVVLFILRLKADTRLATYFFLLNFTIQICGHYILDDGMLGMQGTLFSFLFAATGFLLMDRRWGWGIGVAMIILFVVGAYNVNSGKSLWKAPPELADLPEEGNFKYLALIPMALNMYLLSEFVRARTKAERQLEERKRMIEEKQKEILDSIHYAKRIQKSLMPSDANVRKMLDKQRSAVGSQQ